MRSRLWLGFIGLAVLLAACSSAPAPTATPAAAQPAAVAVQSSTAAEGRLEPQRWANLSFTTGGDVAEILVKEGEAVKAGTVLARLDDVTLKSAVAEAEAALNVVKAAQANYRASLPKQIAAAQADIKAAQAQSAGAAAGRNNSAAIKDAESRLANLRYQQQQILTGMDQLRLYDRANGTRMRDLQQQLDSAVKAIKATEAEIAALRSGSSADQAAAAQIEAATASEQAAQARLKQLQAELDGKATDAFEAQIKQAEAAVLAAKLALSETELKAPFDGTIAQVNLQPGESVAASATAIVLADLSGWQIETSDVTELKVPDLQIGRAATVKVDALPELDLQGQIESIGAVSQLKSGDVVYPVTIKLIDSDPRLRWGMTVAVSFEK